VTHDVPTDSASPTDGAIPSPSQRTVADPNSLLTIIAPIISQATLITGLLYYIGWARTNSLFGYFGVDTSLVGFNTPDFVLRGGSDVMHSLWIYIALGAAPAFGLFAIHRLVVIRALVRTRERSSQPSKITANELCNPNLPYGNWLRAIRQARMLHRWRPGVSFIRWFMRSIQGFAVTLAAAMLAGIVFNKFGTSLGLALPLLLIFSFILLGYVAHIYSAYSDVLATTMTPPAPARPRIYPMALLALGLLAGIWAVSLYGDRLGTSDAISIAANQSVLSEVQVYSTDRIALHGSGIIVSEIAQPGTKYRYQYTGLRLLASPPGRFLLLPSKWQKGRDRVLVLRDNDSIRVDIFTQ
jgi:hypothetical protein